jgi:thiol-disulfide isomerase/thioredoxin
VEYELVDISTPEGQRYGVSRIPLTRVGNREVLGTNLPHLISAVAENLGNSALTRTERMAMANHFDVSGAPVILMYGTQWCSYCRK